MAKMPVRADTGPQEEHSVGSSPTHRAILYEFPQADPAIDRFTRKAASGDVTIVLVGDPEKIPALASELARAGARVIELCGGVPAAVRAKVKAAVPVDTRVAAVAFGIESIVKAAEFNQAFMDGIPPAEACIVMTPGADPVADRFVRSSGPQNATFIMAGERAAPGVARQLAGEGVGLIELYGGFSDVTVTEIVETVAGRSAVGVSGFGQ
jgi:hypothetical protein